jgi:hypothetical protein
MLSESITGATIFADGIHSWRAVFKTIPTRNTYITSSDEALCVTLYKNCAQRFVYAAKCQKNNIEEDRESKRWQSKWSDIKAGQNNFAGFHPVGRECYAKLHRHIAKIKKKEETKNVEKEILKAIQ